MFRKIHILLTSILDPETAQNMRNLDAWAEASAVAGARIAMMNGE